MIHVKNYFLGSMEYFQRDLKISSELGSQVREECGTLFVINGGGEKIS